MLYPCGDGRHKISKATNITIITCEKDWEEKEKKSICIPAQSRGVEEADNKGLGDSTLCLSGNSSFRDIELIQEKTYLFILQIFIKFLLITKFWKLGKLTPIALTY